MVAARLLCLVLVLAPSLASATDIEFKLDKQLFAFWGRMPQMGTSGPVKLHDATSPDCAELALRQAKPGLGYAIRRRGAWDAIKMTVDIAPVGGKVLDGVSLLVDYLDSESPEDFVKKIGKTLVSKGAGELAGKGARYGAGKGAGKLYDQLTAKLEKGFDYTYQSSSCGLVTINAFVRRRIDRRGLEMTFTIAGDCRCQVKDRFGKFELGAWWVRGTLPLTYAVKRDGDDVTVTFSIASGTVGTWDVSAQCPCKLPRSPDDSAGGVPPDDRGTKIPAFNEGFTSNDWVCLNRCFGKWTRYKSRKSRAGETERAAQKAEASAKSAEDMAAKNRAGLDSAKATLKNPPQGDPNLGDILRKANDTIKNQKHLDNTAQELRKAADHARSSANLSKRLAEAALAELKDCLRHCIRQACAPALSTGFGDGKKNYLAPDWARAFQKEILLPLLEQMRRAGQLKDCPRKKDEDAAYEGGEPIAYGLPALEYDSPKWCTYGGGTTSLALASALPPFDSSPPDPGSDGPVDSAGGDEPPGSVSPSGVGTADDPRPVGPATSLPGAPAPEAPPADASALGTSAPDPARGQGQGVAGDAERRPPRGLRRSDDRAHGDEEATDAPAESPEPKVSPPATTTLIIKAKKTVLAGGVPTAVALPGALVKLDLGDAPALPVAGNPKDDQGFDHDPIQGVADENGDLALEVPSSLAAALATTEIEIDATPQDSVIVHGAPGAAVALPDAVRPWLARQFPIDGVPLAVLRFPEGQLDAVTQALKGVPGIELVEPNPCRDKQDDPFFRSAGTWGQTYDDQWAIHRVGLTTGADSAWTLLDESTARPVVAVIDTGLDWNHRDFSWANLWTNPAETENGKDDDGDGHVDDLIGWDFWDDDNLPWDTDGHGTFVSGVIAATTGNDVGIAGINPHARIMVVRALNGFGHSRASYVAEAIVYAADHDARIINLSVGGEEPTRAEQMAIDHAWSRGALIVVAAGNDGLDVAGFAPSGLEHALTVGATGVDDARAPYSNWGAGIDLAAPGNDVLSLRARRTDLMLGIPGVEYTPRAAYVGEDRRYYRASGTSFAAPIVSGVASLVLSHRPGLTNEELTRVLRQSARDIETPGVDQFTGYGLVDARAALQADPDHFVTAALKGVSVVETGAGRGLEVAGSADADRFAGARVEIGAGEEPTEWKQVGGPLDAPVSAGRLTVIPAGELRGAPVWMIRLVVLHEDGSRREARFRLALQ